MKLRSRRAVSTVIATLLMINVALVLGVMAYLYSQNMMGTLTSNYNIYLERQRQAMQERISIVNVRFNDSTNAPYKFNITVVNSGSRQVSIAAIYLNGSDILSGVTKIWNRNAVEIPISATYQIVVGDMVTFAFDSKPSVGAQPMSYGKLYTIAVVTSTGVADRLYWTATRGS